MHLTSRSPDAERLAINAQIEGFKNKTKKVADADEREEIVRQIAELNEKLTQLEKRTGTLLYVTDVTPEKLAEMLSEHGETLAHIDSDAADALGIITGTRYSDGKHTQETVWLKAYSGEATSTGRKSGKSLHLSEPCVAVLFVATPDKVQELFRNPRLTSGGLLPRFLACDPGARPVPLDPSAPQTAHKLPSDVSQPYEAAIFAAIHRYRISAAEDPDEIDMMPAAHRLLRDDWNRFCAATNGAHDYPFEARHTENAIRVALVLHAFQHVAITQRSEGTFNALHHAHEHAVSEATLRDALRIRDWFTLHQENLRKPERAAADEEALHKVQAMMKARSPAVGITARDLYNGRKVCDNAEAALKFLEQWKAEGSVEEFQRKPEGAGRPTTAYRLPPLSRS